MRFKIVNMQKHAPLMAIACGLLGALGVGLAGCGGGSSNSDSGPDRSADFSLIVDPVSVNTVLQSGQTTPITLEISLLPKLSAMTDGSSAMHRP